MMVASAACVGIRFRNPISPPRFYCGVSNLWTSWSWISATGFAFSREWMSRGIPDLGEVFHLAEVRLNGKRADAVWGVPWRVDVTEAATGP
jgi:hypothetical protein